MSADIHNYQSSTIFRNFSGSYVHRITANAVIVLPSKIIPATSSEVQRQYLIAKVQIKFVFLTAKNEKSGEKLGR